MPPGRTPSCTWVSKLLVASIVVVIVLGTTAWWILSQREGDAIEKSAEPAALALEDREISAPSREVPAELTAVQEHGLTILRGSAFDRDFLAPGHSQLDDLTRIHELWQDTMLLIKNIDSLPLADNRDFVLLWTGNNDQRVAWIPPEHPGVNESGELIDRWGSPIIIHRVSARVNELRSPGPDRQAYTADDVLLGPATLPPGLGDP